MKTLTIDNTPLYKTFAHTQMASQANIKTAIEGERHVPFFATYYVTYSDDTEEKKEDEEEEEENRANNLLFVQIVGRFYAVTLLKWAFHRT